jgi:Ser/Thr protein kinase RdoA (MazF antagonist)
MKEFINENYPVNIDNTVFLRDGGSTSYLAVSGGRKYFFRVIKSAFHETAVKAAQIQVFLRSVNFSAAKIISANSGKPYVLGKKDGKDCLCILYEFIDGKECEPEEDAEKIGALIGKLHSAMGGYSDSISQHGKHYYIGRYMDILKKKNYPKADEFKKYGDWLWDKIKDLPRGYCHGDMYSGNIHKTPDGELYVLDFDTSCEGFPLYDLALICNRTDYFNYDEMGYAKTKAVFERMLPEYKKHRTITQPEINAVYDMIALYHFALQATIIEMYGINCVDEAFLNNQLDWLRKWREQCGIKHAQ